MPARTLAAAYCALLDRPRLLLMLVALTAAVAVYFTGRFSFDASSDTLLQQQDRQLATYEEVAETFTGDDFLLLTFTPAKGPALSDGNLDTLARLQSELGAVAGVTDTFSVLDAPLLNSPPVPLDELAEGGFKTLESPGVDFEMAREELINSPLFRELLITADGRTTALRIDLAFDETLPREAYLDARAQTIAAVRDIRDRYRDDGTLYLGGVPMIAADMIRFVKNDLAIFGSSVVVLIMAALYAFFRQWRWVLLPIACSGLTILYTTGVLGFVGKPATVVSSNFVSLLAIINISFSIHLIVRYRELLHRDSQMSVRELVNETMLSKFAPCLYNALTTIAAFGSLMASTIKPVEDFGWMMCLGISLGFVVMFLFFPAVLRLLPARPSNRSLGRELTLTRVLSHAARWRSGAIVAVALGATVLAVVGLNRVSLDNRFLEYFKEDTDIYQGMRFIDAELGGTVPFDVILEFAPWEEPAASEDDFFFEPEAEDAYPQRYWFTRDKLDRLTAVHRYLAEQPAVGKVMSLTALEDVARTFTDGNKLSSAQIAAILGALPEELRAELIAPYADPPSGRLRLNARVVESGPAFDRAALAEDVERYAMEEAGFDGEDVTTTGMMVLFDAMLKKLYSSQIDTLAYVLGAMVIMFLVLLRSLLYTVVGLLPNVLAAALVVSFMGFAGIPLDMMTITIAAVSVGIGVDDAIHYLHRFKEEYAREGEVRLAVAWSHATTGRAMYFTSLTIIVGFSVLGFSNFVPTVYFGLLVALAMALALLANLTLLPGLLVLLLGKRPAAPVPQPNTGSA